MNVLDLDKIKKKIRLIIEERSWERFQTPKNITMALTKEASELMEIFQWLNEQESYEIKRDSLKMEKVKDEIADVLYWLVRISDVLEIDINEAFWEKIKKNEKKYPIDLAKGNAKKYSELLDKDD